MRNAIVMGFPVAAIDVRDAATVAGTEEDPLDLTIENSLFFENGADGDNFRRSHHRRRPSNDDEASSRRTSSSKPI